MPSKQTTKTRTSTSGTSKKSSFKFRWWMALTLVGIVVVVGILVLRFSRASGGNTFPAVVQSNYYGVLFLKNTTPGVISTFYLFPAGGGLYFMTQNHDGPCVRLYPSSFKAVDQVGSPVTVDVHNCG
jgi:hypothetical protein